MDSEKTGERLKEAFNYLKKNEKVRYQRDVARLMGANEVTVSRAFKGIESYCNKTFLLSFNQTFDNVFSMDWLMGADVPMLAKKAEPARYENKDIEALANRLESLMAQVNAELQDLRLLKVELRATIAILNQRKNYDNTDVDFDAYLRTTSVADATKPTYDPKNKK